MKNKGINKRSCLYALASLILVAAYPADAMAAEGGVDASILIPKPAEFFPALIAFLIIWILLAKKVWPQVLENLDARQAKIEGDLDDAAQAKAKAQEELKDYRQKIANANVEADKIIAEAKKKAESEHAQIKNQAAVEAEEIVAHAHEAAEFERHAALADLTSQAADLSVEIAEKILMETLKDTEEQHKLIEKCLEEAGNLNAK